MFPVLRFAGFAFLGLFGLLGVTGRVADFSARDGG